MLIFCHWVNLSGKREGILQLQKSTKREQCAFLKIVKILRYTAKNGKLCSLGQNLDRKKAEEVDVLNVAMFGMTAKEW